jgi:HAD superfamily hydrolase (TIGR01490 family)
MRLALFDLDNTLLTGDCDYEWIEFLIGRGVLERKQADAADEIERNYKAGKIGEEESCLFYLESLAGREKAMLDEWHLDFMRERVVPNVPQQALELLAQHRDADDLIVLTSGTNRFLIEPVAAYLAIEHLIATEVECIDGKFTGNYTGVVNMGEGKVKRLDVWLAERGYSWLDFKETWFYSDSRNDIPLLDRVSRPVAVDPDEDLATHAHARGWPVLRMRQYQG